MLLLLLMLQLLATLQDPQTQLLALLLQLLHVLLPHAGTGGPSVFPLRSPSASLGFEGGQN
jgi:hypothetical protein